MEPLFFILFPLAIVPLATLIVYPDERAPVQKIAPFLLGALLFINLALISMPAPLWLQLSLTAILALGLACFSVLEVSRWLLGPLFILTPGAIFADWALSTLIITSITTGALLATTIKRKTLWQQQLILSLRWLAPILLSTSIITRALLLL